MQASSHGALAVNTAWVVNSMSTMSVSLDSYSTLFVCSGVSYVIFSSLSMDFGSFAYSGTLDFYSNIVAIFSPFLPLYRTLTMPPRPGAATPSMPLVTAFTSGGYVSLAKLNTPDV